MEEKRYISFDILRIISSILVIGIHTLNILSDVSDKGFYIANEIVRSGLPIFFLLTSITLVNKKDYTEHLDTFYIQKIKTIFLPFLVYSIGYFLYSGKIHVDNVSELVAIIFAGIKATIAGSQYFHLWYIYALLGLYLIIPFLKKMLNSLDFNKAICLAAICFIVNAINVWSIPINVSNYPFTSWIVYYFIGYVILQDGFRRFDKIFIPIGILCGVLSIFIQTTYSYSVFIKNIADISPLMMLFAGSIFLIFYRSEKICDRFPHKKFIYLVSGLTYYIYLGHPLVILLIAPIFNQKVVLENQYIRFILFDIVVFFVTAMSSVFIKYTFFQPKLLTIIRKIRRR